MEGIARQPDESLPNEALVVRGGEMTITNLSANAETKYEEFGIYALSFWSASGMDVGGIVRLARAQPGRNIPHGAVQVSTAGRIRAAGYELVPTPPLGHYSVFLPDPPTPADYAALMSAFDPPQPNPEGRLR